MLSIVGLAAMGCQRDDSKVGEKLDQIAQRLDGIEKQLASGAGARGAAGAAGQRGPGAERKRPDPSKVYAVPATGPTIGPKDAKVTIVEAFEFA
jgi:protein-disulfide isomerase